jgi:hypothetical protein
LSVQLLIGALLDRGLPASGLLGISLPLLWRAELLEAATGDPWLRFLIRDARQIAHLASLELARDKGAIRWRRPRDRARAQLQPHHPLPNTSSSAGVDR